MQQRLLILQALQKNGRLFRLQCFARDLGRLWCSSISPKYCLFSPLSLIEAHVEQPSGTSFCLKNAEPLDTFAEQRSDPKTAKGLLLMGSIIENCVPLGAPTPCTFDLVLALFNDARLFADWKVPPLILGMSLFEHEGIDLSQLCSSPALSKESRAAVTQLAKSSPSDLYSLSVEPDLLQATLESIGVAKNCNLQL